MPEGPSIVILKEEVSLFKNKKVKNVLGNTKTDVSRVKGRPVLEFRSWGKHFLICFDDFFIRIHLLMFGSYRINERKEGAARLSLQFSKGELNFYNCSVKVFEGSADSVYDWKADTMSDRWDPNKALEAIKQCKKSMICDVLLDQTIFAGVGNIIKNEVLFITKIHPGAKIKDLPVKKLRELVEVTRAYCFDFYAWKKKFELKQHWLIYRKSICPRCNIPLVINYLGKTKRKTYFCPNCQFLSRKDFIKIS
jgi:endonuclease-8